MGIGAKMKERIGKTVNGLIEKICKKVIVIARKGLEFLDKSEKTVYHDFAPTDTISADTECIKTLHWALTNKNVKNVALTGPYGAGKSSVIKSYLKEYGEENTISVSLASFEGNQLNENELEKGILKQMFYKIDAERIPLSRYRKLHHVKLWRYVVGIVSTLFVLVAGLYIAFPNKVVAEFKRLFADGKNVYERLVFLFSVLIVIWGLSFIIRFITSRFTVKEVSVGDISAKGDSDSANQIFNKNMDEILYFFEKTSYKIVFIEDLDRFGNNSIFIKLRELNSILNNYDVLRKTGKITFVYAVKDELFKGDTERTKFFDFIIPIIPVINTTNSAQILRNLLNLSDKKGVDGEEVEHFISEKFITLVSPYIGDMRVLNSIVNEFWIYKRTLKDKAEIKLNDESILAFMIYKNLYPVDFANLENERGNVKLVFENKMNVIQELTKNLENEKTKLGRAIQDNLETLKEIKLVVLSAMCDDKGYIVSITRNNLQDSYQKILEDDFYLDKIRQGNIVSNIRYLINSGPQNKQFDNLESSSDRFRELFARYDVMKETLKLNEEQKRERIQDIDKQILQLHTRTIQQLIAQFSAEQVLPEEVMENKLLIFFLRHGYINENYADYINYFHPGSISKEEQNFIRAIRDCTGIQDFNYVIKNKANVIASIEDYEFEQVESLNFDLTDHLLSSNRDDKKRRYLIKQLVDRTETSKKFVLEYLKRGVLTNEFIKRMCKTSEYFWKDIVEEITLPQVTKDQYLCTIVDVCSMDNIVKNNNAGEEDGGYIKGYIENDRFILQKFSALPMKKTQDVLEKLEIVFDDVELLNVSSEMINYILENRYYVLNDDMMEEIFKALAPDKLDMVFKANYKSVLQLGNAALIEYIEDDFCSYVEKFVMRETNTEETTFEVEQILNKLFMDNCDICVQVIEKQPLARWKYLDECLSDFSNEEKQEIWDCLLINQRIDITWDNYLLYRDTFGTTARLLEYLENNIDELLEDKGFLVLENEIINEMLEDDISDNTFKKIIGKSERRDLNLDLKVLSEIKIMFLIEKQMIQYTDDVFLTIREKSRIAAVELIKQNVEPFVENMQTYELTVEDVKLILASGILSSDECLRLLKCIDVEDMDTELAKIIREFDYIVDKEYVDAAWNVLEESDKYQLLLNQLDVYSLDEIATKFSELDNAYEKFTRREKRKYSLYASSFNKALCEKLYWRDFITSRNIEKQKIGYDKHAHKDIYEERIVGFVKGK